jgi:hypothetical protein
MVAKPEVSGVSFLLQDTKMRKNKGNMKIKLFLI